MENADVFYADVFYMELTSPAKRLLSPLQPEFPVVEMKISLAHTPSSKQSGYWICRLIREDRIATEIAASSFTSPEVLAVNAALYGFKALRRRSNVLFNYNHGNLGEVLTSTLDGGAELTVEMGNWVEIMSKLRSVREWNDLLAAAEEHVVIGLGRSWFVGDDSGALWNQANALVHELDPEAGWASPFGWPDETSVSR